MEKTVIEEKSIEKMLQFGLKGITEHQKGFLPSFSLSVDIYSANIYLAYYMPGTVVSSKDITGSTDYQQRKTSNK